MPVTSLFFNGRLLSIPGSYSEVDASGLEQVGLGASGIVALLGTAIGGKPYTAIDPADVRGTAQVATKPSQPSGWFRSGDLREGAPLLFNPCNDDAIAGAQAVIFVKVNPAAKSTASFANTDGEAMVLSSRDWGWHTTQIKATIATGTVKGKRITLTFEATEEVFDDVGGDAFFTLTYLSATPAKGYTTITAAVSATALTAAFTRTGLGLDGDISAVVTPGQVVELVSSSASDTAVVVEIVGTNVSNATQRERVTLTGTVALDTIGLWNAVHGARIVSGTAVGTITLRNDGAGTTITTLTAGVPTKGLDPCVSMAATGALAFVADAASTAKVTVIGLSATGAIQTEVITLNGTTPVAGVATWSRLDYLALGGLAAARTLTVSGTALSAVFAGVDTLQKLADKVNGTAGFTLTLGTLLRQLSPTNLDHATATNILSPAAPTFTASLYQLLDVLNTSSALVTAARGSVGSGVPSNISNVYLAGGHEGSATPGSEAVPTTTQNDWQAALDLLTKVFCNSVQVLTADAAVHAALKAHLDWMAGAGRGERDSVVGLMNAGKTAPPTKTEIKAQIVALNNRNIAAWGQRVSRYDTSGTLRVFEPPFGALLVAGAQAGAALSTPMTRRILNTVALSQDSSWNPTDDAEELIQAGLLFAEQLDGVGRRIVRGVTSNVASSNAAFTDKTMNRCTNYAVYNFRTAMDAAVGKAGFVGTVAATDTEARAILGELVGLALTAWRSLTIELLLDVLEIDVEMAPLSPINFVKNTIHLVTLPITAAA